MDMRKRTNAASTSIEDEEGNVVESGIATTESTPSYSSNDAIFEQTETSAGVSDSGERRAQVITVIEQFQVKPPYAEPSWLETDLFPVPFLDHLISKERAYGWIPLQLETAIFDWIVFSVERCETTRSLIAASTDSCGGASTLPSSTTPLSEDLLNEKDAVKCAVDQVSSILQRIRRPIITAKLLEQISEVLLSEQTEEEKLLQIRKIVQGMTPGTYRFLYILAFAWTTVNYFVHSKESAEEVAPHSKTTLSKIVADFYPILTKTTAIQISRDMNTAEPQSSGWSRILRGQWKRVNSDRHTSQVFIHKRRHEILCELAQMAKHVFLFNDPKSGAWHTMDKHRWLKLVNGLFKNIQLTAVPEPTLEMPDYYNKLWF